jgi:hypothetical protein
MMLTDCRYPRKVPSPGVIFVSGRDLNRSGTWCVSHLVSTGEVRMEKGKNMYHLPVPHKHKMRQRRRHTPRKRFIPRKRRYL